MENFVNLQPDLSINSLYSSTSQENNNYLIQKTSMKFENFTFPGEQKLPIDNIFYFQSPTNETRNSCMELMTTKCPELEFPKDLQQFSYNLTSVPSETENDFSLIVPLANHFSGEEMIEEDAQFLVGAFENEENDGIIDELLDFMFTAAQENFLRLTGMSYEEYQRRKDRSEDRGYNFAPPGMMGFATKHLPSWDDEKVAKANSIIRANKKFVEKSKYTREDTDKFIEQLVYVLSQGFLCKEICPLKIRKDGVYYEKDNTPKQILFKGEDKDSAIVLYIFFLLNAVRNGRKHKGKVEYGIILDELSKKHRNLLQQIGGFFASKPQHLTSIVSNICKYPNAYIQNINNTLEQIFAEDYAEDYIIKEGNNSDGDKTYYIKLQWDKIDLGEFENLI